MTRGVGRRREFPQAPRDAAVLLHNQSWFTFVFLTEVLKCMQTWVTRYIQYLYLYLCRVFMLTSCGVMVLGRTVAWEPGLDRIPPSQVLDSSSLRPNLLLLTTDTKHWLRAATFYTAASEMRLQGAQVGPILPSVSGEGNLLPPAGAGRFHSLRFCALRAEGTTQVHVWYRYLPEAYKASHMASPRSAHELRFSLHGTEAIKQHLCQTGSLPEPTVIPQKYF